MSNELKSRSKSLSYWLRHKPEDGNLTLDAQGWTPIHGVLDALARKGLATDRALLDRVVAENDKKRFEYSEDGTQIRARQGHSISVEGSWEEAEPPAQLIHGTVEKFLEPIMREGLRPMNRHHVHLSPDVETASKVGQRRGKPVLLRVDAAAMRAAGHAFYLSSNGVWLTDTVPPEFLSHLDS